MTEKDDKKQVSIKIGNVSGVSGNFAVAGGDITIHTQTGLSAEDIAKLFNQLYTAIEARPNTSPANQFGLKTEVQAVQAAVTEAAAKDNKVDESSLAYHFDNIIRMAPDILEVVTTTLVNPLGGLGLVVKKIADKAKAEAAH